MAESTLSMTYSDYREEIGFYLGYGRDSSNWTEAQESAIESILKSGLRQFFNPPVISGSNTNHEWSFLNIEATLDIGSVDGVMSGVAVYDGSAYSTITATSSVFIDAMANESVNLTFGASGEAYEIHSVTSGTICVVVGDASGEASGDAFTVETTSAYDLPDDFGSMNGPLMFPAGLAYGNVPVTGIKSVETSKSVEITGVPERAAIRPKSSDGTRGQRYEMVFYPTPSGNWSMRYFYSPLVNTLSSDNPYPYGGMQHSETILASCLAVAEMRMMDSRGEKYAEFLDRLRASVSYDEKAHTAELIGRMRNDAVWSGISYENALKYNDITVK